MNYRPLGSTGLECSTIGLGTVKLGRTAGLKYAVAAPGRLPTDDEALALLQTAAGAGVNLVDTAPAYGVSEERLGTLLPQVRGSRPWIIVTKVGETFNPAANGGAGASSFDFSRAAIKASVDRSLARLRVPTLDCVLLHFSSTVDDVAIIRAGEAMGALGELRSEGKIRAIGASAGTAAGGLLAVEAGADVVMVTINPSEQWGIAVAADAKVRGCGVLVKKAMGGGRHDAREAVRFAAGQPGVSSVVVGTTNPGHLLAVVGV